MDILVHVAEFLSFITILASFELINRKNRWGFILMIFGQVLATAINLYVGLYWLGLMHAIIIALQIRGFQKWSSH